MSHALAMNIAESASKQWYNDDLLNITSVTVMYTTNADGNVNL